MIKISLIMIRLSPYFSVAVLGILSFSVGLHGINRVFVKPEALDEYLVERARDESKKVQTYQFLKGKYHPGNRMDRGMEKVTFEELAYDLAIQLRKQNFYPIPELGKSDLLIVVHYGSTGYPDDFQYYEGLEDYRFQYYDELGDYRRPRGLEGLSSVELVHVKDTSYRAKLLGMDFKKTWASEKRLLSALSSQQRYFILLYAYDFQLLQQGEIKLLWRTRYSIRAIGQSFENAITHMNRIASDYMGQNLKGFVQKRVDDTSFVSYGEIEVIDVEKIKEEDQNTNFLNFNSSTVPDAVLEPQFER